MSEKKLVLIIEANQGYIPQTETELEEKAVKLFSKHKGPVFVLQSSMNIDRIGTM